MARKNKKQRKHPKFWLGFKLVLLLFLLTILVGGIIFYFKYGKDIFAMQDDAVALVKESSIDTFRSSETSIVYNNKGKEIAKLKGEKDSYYLTLDKIPKAVKDAAIVTEDKKFYSHNGIDAKGIMRAVLALIKNNGEKTQGASTITQQLARGVFLSTEKTYERKIKEIFIALELEKKYTKSQILEFYLNTIYYANGYYGIEAAARGYFGKSCQELSLGQLCFLCSIPNNPTLYNPLKNFDNTVKRKNRILDQMLDDGVITKVDYDEAYQEEIKLNIQEVQKRDYIQTFVSYCAIRELMKKNGFEFKNSFADKEERETYETEYDDAYSTAQQMLLNKGYKIYTSFDLKKQKKLQKAVNHNLSGFKDKETNGTYKMQGSAVCIDNKTGRVVALVGGRSQETEGLSLNRAYQSYRQPGSSIKPLIVYTPTLERGSTASTTVHDYKFKGGPSNSSGRYYGYVSLRFAVEQSLNTVAMLGLVIANQLKKKSENGNSEEIKRLEQSLHTEQSTLRQELTSATQISVKNLGDMIYANQYAYAINQSKSLNQLEERLKTFSLENEQKLENIRRSVESRLNYIQEDNNRKLEEMRKTVDERLQQSIEEKMNRSFSLVSERLEQVYKGLGEMQNLANGVGDLKKVLTNVKTRGTLGEYQLSAILSEILSPEQYEENVATKKGSRNVVEFAVKLPSDDDKFIYLPIDSKFPGDTYSALRDAIDEGDKVKIDLAAKALIATIKSEAKDIHDKYIDPPYTTEFAIMFLPFEGLYSEVVNRGLVEILQRDYKVNIAGPSTMAALLNSLQMGFKTLAVQKRSAEVWEILGAVKQEFDKFGDVLAATQQRLDQANKELDKLVGVRTRQIQRKLKDVQTPTRELSDKIFSD